jgi:hypothetical protein
LRHDGGHRQNKCLGVPRVRRRFGSMTVIGCWTFKRLTESCETTMTTSPRVRRTRSSLV